MASLPAFPDLDFPAPMTLADGRVVAFGPITPAAKPLIQAAVARMSPETSRRRFFTVRRRLSDLELARLTELDGFDRFAIGAATRDPVGDVEGVGVARFARLAERPQVAEFALVVIDAFQRRGIGRRLLHALARAALARGIDRLRGLLLVDNLPMQRLLVEHAPGLVGFELRDELEVELRLDARRIEALAA
jgi:GNAT superfamily N-acetyltransferase